MFAQQRKALPSLLIMALPSLEWLHKPEGIRALALCFQDGSSVDLLSALQLLRQVSVSVALY